MSPEHHTKHKTYLCYGLGILSAVDLSRSLTKIDTYQADYRLEPRKARSAPGRLDFEMNLSSGHGRSLRLLSDQEIGASVAGQKWCFEVKGVVRFYWTGMKTRIHFEALEAFTDELLAFWFIHIFMPLFLTLESRYPFLHASAVEIEGKAVLFSAPSMGGKSTLTDHFLSKGHALISDDKVATFEKAGRFFAVTSHPNHRPYRSVEDLGLRAKTTSASHQPIGAIYLLQPVAADAEITLEESSGHLKFIHILSHFLFNFEFLQESRLRYLSRLLKGVSVYELKVPRDKSRLDEVYKQISEHFKE